ncbi:hypothetical protein BTA51_15520 [Hahella sp. CCB-MM4]|uniref:hybrid sensor histidine kinase/response regulator n=1 Tax=Hahella sp. (strain CCB-MM4) TaxID=1926491 RepID=UPI000BDA3B51|nr:ATP-binding protein [Hahella sp. CCB-MM4]OZG72525.1 hypothetical protein BTA51_15520 [Hahella sp. CCB-MM4]
MNEQLIINASRAGYYNLNFEPELERLFETFQFKRIRRRLGVVNLVALVFFVIYSLVDYLIFPFEVASWTIPIRLFLVAPVIVISTIINCRTRSPRLFFFVYMASYFVCGMAVVAIIWIAHSNNVMVPYDGLFLVLSYGYFVMSIPFRHALVPSWLIFAFYAVAEVMADMPPDKLYLNMFFLAGANLIGSVGSYIQEHNLRSSFLNQQLLHIRQAEADRENKAKTRFIATASHDLRQPLNAMNLLLEGMPKPAPGDTETSEVQQKLKRSLDQLNGLLGTLLDISRLNLGVIKPHCSAFDLHDLVERIIEEQVKADDASPAMLNSIPEGTGIYSDPILIERILRNLLSNSLKHAEADNVVIDAEISEEWVTLVFRDDGRGIPKEHQEKVFQEFQQVRRNNGRPPNGLGLGLAIVQQLSELMDISLQLESDEGAGTVFRLTIPASDPVLPSAQESAAGGMHQVLSGVRIWLVEDDETNREALTAFVTQCGAEVVSLAGYGEFVAQLDGLNDASTPDLMLTDYRLGHSKTGLSVVKLIRKLADRFVPAIILSADVEKVRDLSDDRPDIVFLTKPVTPARLLSAIRSQLSQPVA